MTEALIYDHVRTPRGKGKKDGSLHQATPVWLLRGLLRSLQSRLALDTALVDDVVLGCVTPVGEQGADIARTAVLDAGWDERVAGVTLSRFCASGLEAVNLAAAKVASGFEDLVVAGGIESMSRWTMGSDGGAWFMDPRINSGLGFVPQGVSADLIATLEGFSRHDLDAYALQSHQRAAANTEFFAGEIIPVGGVDRDEGIRADASLEKIAALGPAWVSDEQPAPAPRRAVDLKNLSLPARAVNPRPPRARCRGFDTLRGTTHDHPDQDGPGGRRVGDR